MTRQHDRAAELPMCLALLLAQVDGAWAQDKDHDKWIDMLSVSPVVHQPGSAAAATTSGKASLATPPDDTRSPTRLVLDVPRGALQQALSRAHQERSTLDAATRGTDPAGAYLEWKLTKVQVTSYSYSGASGSARVVLEAGQAGQAAPAERAVRTAPAERDDR